MKRSLLLFLAAASCLAAQSPLTLWYRHPANLWVEALPAGNGHMGAMVFGGPSRERIQFNESTVWTGGPHDYAHHGASRYLQQIRQLLWEGKQKEAEDLAMQEFSDYARCFPTTQYAPNAQYYVGEIYYNKGDYENAMKAFDTVLEQYPENTRTGDAHYMKGNSLVKLQRKEAAVKEYRQVISKYPKSDSASKARTKLRELGVSAGTPRRR